MKTYGYNIGLDVRSLIGVVLVICVRVNMGASLGAMYVSVYGTLVGSSFVSSLGSLRIYALVNLVVMVLV